MKVLSTYLAKLFAKNILIILSGLLAIIYIFDTLELLRRSVKKDDIPISIVLQMSAYKLPEVGQQLIPFAILFAAILTLWQLSRRHELVIFRTAGLSAWRFLSPLFMVAIAFGILYLSVLNPFAAAMIRHYDTLQSIHLEQKSSVVTIVEDGLWLKEKDQEGESIFFANSITHPDWKLQNVMVLFFNTSGVNYQRLDAQSVKLEDKRWVFQDAVIHRLGAETLREDEHVMSTEMTIEDIRESFADPDTISFWNLPSFIETLRNTGLQTTSMEFHYQELLSRPFLFAAMVLIAAAVSLRPPRAGGNVALILAGIAAGFTVFFVSNFLKALGTSDQLPIIMAAWAPSFICILVGTAILMRTEDG